MRAFLLISSVMLVFLLFSGYHMLYVVSDAPFGYFEVAESAAENQAKAERVNCLKRSNFTFSPHDVVTGSHHNIMSNMQMTKFPSTFSARCDWVIGIRASHYNWISANSSWGDITKDPNCIFVRTDLVQTFHDLILPCLSTPFVLVTGDHDVTIPHQVDVRYRKYLAEETWDNILTDSRIIHIFSEHLDDNTSGKVSPLPVGVNQAEFPKWDRNYLQNKIAMKSNFEKRKKKVLRCDRVRDAQGQWEERGKVRKLCSSSWSKWCESAHPSPLFDALLNYSFLLCVHGGGIDPNPKAWEALLAGTIPIMKRFPGDAVYANLPVAFVDEWNDETVSEENLRRWVKELAPYYEETEKRRRVVEILHEDYWWKMVEEKIEQAHPRKCVRTFVSYESSDLEKVWLEGIGKWKNNPCEQARKQHDEIMAWLNATDPNADSEG